MKLNCWQFRKCGRQQGGRNAERLGVCPASLDCRLDGIYGGRNAGRACWMVAGTLCNGTPQGSFTEKHWECESCGFYKKVLKEESDPRLSIHALKEVWR